MLPPKVLEFVKFVEEHQHLPPSEEMIEEFLYDVMENGVIWNLPSWYVKYVTKILDEERDGDEELQLEEIH